MAEILLDGEKLDYSSVLEPINGDSAEKHLLSMSQFNEADIYRYIDEANAAERILPSGINLLPRVLVQAEMRQDSTRTGGSFVYSATKLGATGKLISGMKGSAEGKEEARLDSEVAFATQIDMNVVRTEEEMGPAFAALQMQIELDRGNLDRFVPFINAGDGTNEHPTQTLGDLRTIHKIYGSLKDRRLAIIGDHERYRVFGSLYIAAAILGMYVVAVESVAAPVPEKYVKLLGDKLIRTNNIDEALEIANIAYYGRKPKEYNGSDQSEKLRDQTLNRDYQKWILDEKRMKILSDESIALHARPRGIEIATSTDNDPRRKDVRQMSDMIPMRMAIIALHMGKSIIQSIEEKDS